MSLISYLISKYADIELFQRTSDGESQLHLCNMGVQFTTKTISELKIRRIMIYIYKHIYIYMCVLIYTCCGCQIRIMYIIGRRIQHREWCIMGYKTFLNLCLIMIYAFALTVRPVCCAVYHAIHHVMLTVHIRYGIQQFSYMLVHL